MLSSSSKEEIALQPPAERALQLLTQAGFDAYAVGGCIRDALMHRPCGDWDITTSARPEQTARVFRDFRTIETGLQHGTLTVIVDGMPLEITTFRTDVGYSDGRHPDAVRFASNVEDDLARRDFTMNAIAYAPRTGLVDPFDGRNDIERHLIRCVGDPLRRFSEDGLRIMRAARFCAVLGFDIEAATAEAMQTCSGMLSCVSAERKAAELSKLLLGSYAPEAVSRCLPVLRALMPVEETAAGRLRMLPPSLPLRLAALPAAADTQAAEAALQALRLDNKTLRAAKALLESRHVPLPRTLPDLRRAMGRWDELWDSVLQLARADGRDTGGLYGLTEEVRRRGDCVSLCMLAADGRMLYAAGLRDEAIGQTLAYLLEEVIEDRLPNEKKALLDAAGAYMANKKDKIQK